jgi:hypothetical protein
MAKELMEIGGFITEGAEIVNHDNTLSGNGTVDSPLGVDSDYIVVTEETVGTYSVNTSDVLVEKTFTKAGYKPIAWMYKLNQAPLVNFNQEASSITSTNGLHFQGYARRVVGSGDLSVTVKLFITWIKA